MLHRLEAHRYSPPWKKYIVTVELALYNSSWFKGYLKIIPWMTLTLQGGKKKKSVFFLLLWLQKDAWAWSQRRKITAPPSWPHTWVSLNLAYQTWSVIEPSKKSKFSVSIRWFKCKHHTALFLPSFLPFFRHGICHHLWKWHRWVRTLKRTVKLLGSFFYGCSVLSLNGIRLLLDVKWGLIFNASVGITFNFSGHIFTSKVLKRSWAFPGSFLMSGTSTHHTTTTIRRVQHRQHSRSRIHDVAILTTKPNKKHL